MTTDRIALVFFVDALGWEIVRDHDYFATVAPHRYRQRTVLGYSCAAQPTILTGKMPSEHGHWGMFYKAERSEMRSLRSLGLLPKGISGHRRFRRLVLKWHHRRSGFSGYYNLYRIPWHLFGQYDVIEKRDIYAPGAFVDKDVPGPARQLTAPPIAASIFDDLAEREIPYRVWTWRHGLDQSFAELEASFAGDDRPAFVLHYTPHIDAFLHGHVGDAAAVDGAVRMVEQKIVHAVEAAHAIYDEVDVVLFSDHGMAETTGERDVMRIIAGLGLREGRDYLAFYDSTTARFWFENEQAETTVRTALGELDCGSFLTDDDLRREGVFFDDRRFGELVFLMNPGTLIVPSYMGARAPRGMHGFSPDHKDSYAVLMSNSEVTPEPSHIRDSYSVMR
ncbi:alkaline phosphatase family protein, partial [bacterium]|nr:alkaline phosphatase family protein [bacterium]